MTVRGVEPRVSPSPRTQERKSSTIYLRGHPLPCVSMPTILAFILIALLSLVVGGGAGVILGRRQERHQALHTAFQQYASQTASDQVQAIIGFLRLVNQFRPAEANAVRGLALECYPDEVANQIRAGLRNN